MVESVIQPASVKPKWMAGVRRRVKAGSEGQPDLHYLKTILVTAGVVNRNDDAFDQLETGQHGARLVMAAAHWGTFKLTDEPMDEPPTRMRELWRAAGRDGKGLCIMRHGETRIIP